MRWSLSFVTFSRHDDDDFIGVQVQTEGDGGAVPFELQHPYGFAARPLDPIVDATGEPTRGCSVLYGEQGNQTFAWLGSDPRSVSLFPALQKGESVQYGPTGQFIRCHADGSVSIFTTDDATYDGRSVFLRVAPTGLTFEAPWGRMTFDEHGFHVLTRAGARLDLGYADVGLPAPLDGLTSYAKLTAQMVSLKGTATVIGANAGATNDAGVTALLVELALLRAALTGLGAVIPTPLSPLISQIGAHA